MTLNRVSHSSLRTFQTCPQKYVYTYHHKRVPNSASPALQVGTFVHEALERWWEHGLQGALDWCRKNAHELSDTEVSKVVAMLWNYTPDRDRYKLIENEPEFEVGVVNPETGERLRGWRVVGFADGLLKDRQTGKVVVRECKTTASEILGFGPYWQRLTIDAQVGIYALAFEVDTVVYDVLRKPQLKISKADRVAAEKAGIADHEAYLQRVEAVIAKEPEAWHQWREIPIGAADMELARASLYKAVKALEMAEEAEVFPMHSGSCAGFGTCKYLGVCTGNDDLWDPVRFRDKLSRAELEAQRGGGE